ncbi:MAG: acyl-CoA dehydratase activase [candidate division WOR-3 bacterium]
MAKTAGIDIGSRTIKVALLQGKNLLHYQIFDTGIDPLGKAKEILQSLSFDHIVATGYGRHLLRQELNCPVITEIKAYALGTNFLFPNCRTVIDIGGQDSKVIRIEGGKVLDFVMNDRCAAGTGKFLEVMAQTLGYVIEEFWQVALKAKNPLTINAMCTVFAESEVVSLIAQGEKVENIALGLHQAVVNRIFALLGNIGFEEEIIFAGGVAKNLCIVSLLKKKLGKEILIPQEPQIVGAIGAALSISSNREEGIN